MAEKASPFDVEALGRPLNDGKPGAATKDLDEKDRERLRDVVANCAGPRHPRGGALANLSRVVGRKPAELDTASGQV